MLPAVVPADPVHDRFQQLQDEFLHQYKAIFHDKMAPRTVVIIPSLTLDREILKRVKGHFFYEERMLCLLMLLHMPRTHITYVTSVPIDPVIVDYYLHLLPGITGYHARQRITLLSCFDASPVSLTEKILARPRLIERIKSSIPSGHPAHIAFFNITDKEKELAVQLDLPLYGTDPQLNYLGSKTGSRRIFRECGILMPDGYEDVKSEAEAVHCLARLKQKNPELRKAVIKLNEGFSGEGNATFHFDDAPADAELEPWIAREMPIRLRIVAERLSYLSFFEKLEEMGGIVEAFLDGEVKSSPSVQCRINPLGEVDVVSTHDQVLDADTHQVFLGATFPAHIDYAGELGTIGKKVAYKLKEYGALGRLGVDFMSVKENGAWKHYAIEINLRKGGTTHPYLMLQFLTDGNYDAVQGRYFMHDNKQRFYFATDNLQRDCYKGLTPHDLIDIAMCNGLHYNGATEEGVVFHLISALSQYGKLGLVCIGSTAERAAAFYNKVVEVLNRECD
ncbi:MAG TPA: peptide ligase PGM1-related protein [Lacibacter sp.]|nr:peptide ligase PGM1-related protein [Lacibacter sp.]HMO88808.1 peptide ligase PGM1-related protein [Lacibacter sp.]